MHPKVCYIGKLLKSLHFPARPAFSLISNCARLCQVPTESGMPSTDDSPARVLCFDVFELDVRAGELRKNGAKLRLQGQPLQVREVLLRGSGDLVTREDLHSRIWPGDTFFDFDHGLHNAIARLREA